MSASPIMMNLPQLNDKATPDASLRKGLRKRWLHVFYAILFICFTSTSFMGGSHSQIVVNAVWKALFGSWHWNLTGEVNLVSRKVGHFFGYGIVGLIFRSAWDRSAQAFSWVINRWLVPFAAFLSVASTFSVACLDELHQKFLPGRVGSLRDALLDAAGATCLNVIFWALRARRLRTTSSSLHLAPQAR